MDTEHAELRELVKRTLALTEENNRILRDMRSAARWARFVTVVWWILVVAVSGAAYYYYLEPYVQKAEELYGQVQHNTQEAQNYGKQISDFFSQFGKKP